MLAQMGELNTSGWEKIKNKIGIDTLVFYSKVICSVCSTGVKLTRPQISGKGS